MGNRENIMSMFKPSILTIALATAGISSFASHAQEEQPTTKSDVEVIEVKGFRGSVVESINTKRFSSEVVESISAEDIGKLPDSSIAEINCTSSWFDRAAPRWPCQSCKRSWF